MKPPGKFTIQRCLEFFAPSFNLSTPSFHGEKKHHTIHRLSWWIHHNFRNREPQHPTQRHQSLSDVENEKQNRKMLKIPRSVYHGKMVNNKHGEEMVVELTSWTMVQQSWIDQWKFMMEMMGIWPIKMLIYSLKIRIQQPLKKIVSVNFITYLTSELQLSSMSLGLLYT